LVQSKIQPVQLFALIVLFECGSAVVVGLGLEAKQDAWIAILFGIIGGIGLFSLYIYLYTQFPTLPLTNYLEKIIGKFFGRILAIIYICLFLYIAARILRTFCDLLLTTILVETPMWAIAMIMMLPIYFACYLGLEVIARTAETLFPWMIFFGFAFILLCFLSGIPKSENFQPVLGDGWKSVIQAFFPVVLSFPFGESIVFGNLFPSLNDQKKGIMAGFSAMLFSGFILILNTMIIISVIGAYWAKESPFPLLEAVGKINVGNFLKSLYFSAARLKDFPALSINQIQKSLRFRSWQQRSLLHRFLCPAMMWCIVTKLRQ
jgi:spore germination protein KB